MNTYQIKVIIDGVVRSVDVKHDGTRLTIFKSYEMGDLEWTKAAKKIAIECYGNDKQLKGTVEYHLSPGLWCTHTIDYDAFRGSFIEAQYFIDNVTETKND
jgi:hypothetical protein